MLGLILKVGYPFSGQIFFFFSPKVRLLQESLEKIEYNFQVKLEQFVSKLLIHTNKSSTLTQRID